MSRVVRTEVRTRGFFGKLMKWSFILFNLLMLYFVIQGAVSINDGAKTLATDYEKAGYGAGAAIGFGAMLFVWAAGDVILGLFVLFTRGTKTIVEEVAA